jgi:phage terminase large subunit-like protein
MFNMAKAMVEASPDLRQVVAVYRHELRVPASGSSYKVIPADAAGQHGRDLHGVLIDELHVVPREVWDALVTGVGARRQPLVMAITTAGYDRSSLAWEQHEYARGVRDGSIDDPEFLPAIYAADPDDDWTDPSTWAKANPSMDATIKRAYLETECKRAQQLVGYQNAFRRLHCCQWVEQADRWLDLAVWDRGALALPNEATLRTRPCWGGLDLATTHDLTALTLVWPRDPLPGYWVKCWCWLPEATLAERARTDHVPYQAWREQGWLHATAGDVTDFDVVREHIRALAEEYAIREIAFDRWGATQLSTQLQQDGATMVAMGQGFGSLAAPTREFERLVLEGALIHAGHPVLRWMVSNAAVEQDAAGNRKPSKRRSTGRIDGLVSLCMALGRATVASPGEAPSAYADHGLLVV